jgi:hypothetical protein
VDRASDEEETREGATETHEDEAARGLGIETRLAFVPEWHCSRFVFFAAQLSAFRENLRRFSELFPNFS